MDIDLDEDEKYVECRRCCAFNLPAMFIFVSNSPDDTDSLLLTFTALASDHYYLVRRTVACGIHEVRIYDLQFKKDIKFSIENHYTGSQSIRSKKWTDKNRSNKIIKR